MLETIYVNGKSLSWLFIGEEFQIPSYNYATEQIEVAGRDGAILKNRQVKPYEFTIPLVVNNEWLSRNKTHNDILNDIVNFINYDKPVPLQISSQNWFWYAMFDGPIELPSIPQQFPTFELKVVLLDPFKYSDKLYKNTAIYDSVSVVNAGTAYTYPIVTATALKDSTSFLISKNDEDYFMVGQSESALKATKNTNPRLLYDEFTSLAGGWGYLASGGTIAMGDPSGVIGGSIQSDGWTARPKTYGTRSGEGWVGPVLKKSLTRSVQDFTARIKMKIKKLTKTGTGKGYMYLFDEAGKPFAAIGLLDASNTKEEVRASFYLFNEYNESWEWVDTLGSSSRGFAEDYYYLEISRKGLDWSMRTWKYMVDSKGKEFITGRMHRTYRDKGQKYNNNLAQVGFGMYKHTRYSEVDIRIASILVEEQLPKAGDIPILIKKNDKIYIDMQQNLVMINEVPVLEEKDFGSDFFSLDSGVSELFIMPPNTFTTEVVWNDRYL